MTPPARNELEIRAIRIAVWGMTMFAVGGRCRNSLRDSHPPGILRRVHLQVRDRTGSVASSEIRAQEAIDRIREASSGRLQ